MIIKTFINNGAVIHIEDSAYVGITETEYQKSFDKFAMIIMNCISEQKEKTDLPKNG